MRHVETIIVGGGPAGSTCAGRLLEAGREALVLDKAEFPRLKLCAGWVTEKALNDLGLAPEAYPHPILKLDVKSHLPFLPFAFSGLPTGGVNYSIRRTEFDDFLLKRSGAEAVRHEVKAIRQEDGRYIIDDKFSCNHLVGAGGTMCPVQRLVFPGNRNKKRLIATLEKEFSYPARSDTCHLFFAYRGLQGYSWFVPKGNGMVNVGIGGKSKYFRRSGTNIHDHFRRFLDDLVRMKLLDAATAENLGETGHPYYLISYDGEIRRDNCTLIGDAAGLATTDLGEGIGPAIESGLMAADEILGRGTYRKEAVEFYSFAGLAKWLAERFLAPKGARPARIV
ncbi:MAG: NAD(P)/FAD-dependent oxidoreductase [Hyphomicrobiales bacterium]|nr:NAD(P)/FAD-dependent oxidoreductase [Hyphomicrobiales bacterium]